VQSRIDVPDQSGGRGRRPARLHVARGRLEFYAHGVERKPEACVLRARPAAASAPPNEAAHWTQQVRKRTGTGRRAVQGLGGAAQHLEPALHLVDGLAAPPEAAEHAAGLLTRRLVAQHRSQSGLHLRARARAAPAHHACNESTAGSGLDASVRVQVMNLEGTGPQPHAGGPPGRGARQACAAPGAAGRHTCVGMCPPSVGLPTTKPAERAMVSDTSSSVATSRFSVSTPTPGPAAARRQRGAGARGLPGRARP
jgi:hypothetical protein